MVVLVGICALKVIGFAVDLKGVRTRGDGGLNEGNFQIRASLGQDIGSAKAARSGTDNDDVALSIGVQVLEVAARHGAGDFALADMAEGKVVPFSSKFIQNGARTCRVPIGSGGLVKFGNGNSSSRHYIVCCRWRRHFSDTIYTMLGVWFGVMGRDWGREGMILSLVLSRSSYNRIISEQSLRAFPQNNNISLSPLVGQKRWMRLFAGRGKRLNTGSCTNELLY